MPSPAGTWRPAHAPPPRSDRDHDHHGRVRALGDFAGKVLLLVNVASKCGLTPQYDALERLYAERREQGLVVLGFPANDLGGQEPGANDEIADFCRSTFSVDFPMFSKIAVSGPEKHPLYKALTEAAPQAVLARILARS